jgi:hypothetical protein
MRSNRTDYPAINEIQRHLNIAAFKHLNLGLDPRILNQIGHTFNALRRIDHCSPA